MCQSYLIFFSEIGPIREKEYLKNHNIHCTSFFKFVIFYVESNQ